MSFHRRSFHGHGGRRSTRRWAALAILGLTPTLALAWIGAGCSDSETPSGGFTYVDPGGTYGAEITVNVVGRGRVTTASGGLDCPSDCFAKLVFSSASADGAAGSIGLKAIPTPGASFEGWTFETDPIGSRGRGPDNCNPIKRPASQPSIDSKAEQITLPFGEATGTPPAGQEAACAAYTKVPLVYKITANFTKDPSTITDGGSDADAGDGGGGDILAAAPQIGASGREMGVTTSGYLYWMWHVAGGDGISYITSPTTSVLPANPITVQQPTLTISVVEFEREGVVYQSSLDNTLRIVRSGFSSPTTISAGPPPACSALAIDSSYNVYCRSQAGALLQWQYPSYSTMTTLYTGLPFGNDLVVESSSGPAYFSSSSAINSLPLSPIPDGGIATPTVIVSGRSSVANLETYSSSTHLWWTEFGDTFVASPSKSGPTTGTDTQLPNFPSGLSHLWPDTSSGGTYYYVANASNIYRAYYAGGGLSTLFKQGLTGIGGISADSQYVYWTQADGTVRRSTRF